MKSYFANFDAKWIGLVISVLSVVLLYILVAFSLKIAKSEAAACVHPGGIQCPVTAHIQVSSYFGVILLLVICSLGINLMIKSKSAERMQKEATDKTKIAIKALQGDEKKVYETILASQGAIFQSELVEKIGYPKVKVSRILDKLEGKGLIERRRRGLTNIVLVKYK